MTKNKFWSDLIFVQGINILIKTVWILVIDRAVQNLLPAEDYGTYYRLLSMSILFVIVLDLGLSNMNNKEVAQDEQFFKANFFSFFKAKGLLSLCYILLLFIAALALNLSNNQLVLLGVIGMFQVTNSYNQYLRSNLSALHFFKLDGILAVADRLLVIFVCGSWLVIPSLKHNLTINNFVYVQLGGVLITLIIALSVNLKKLSKISSSIQKTNIKALVKESLPYALLITLMAVFTRVDAVMIGQILGDSFTYSYAMCYRLIDAANMMAALFSGMLLPMFARILSNSKEVEKLATTATKVLIIPAMMVALILAPHSREILELMYSNQVDLVDTTTFVLLIFSFTASASVFVFGTLLTAAKRLKVLNKLALLAALSNVILNFWLIPKMGIKGAALATLITQSIFAIGCLAYSYKSFEFKVSSNLSLKIIAVLGLFLLIFYGSLQFFNNSFVHISFGVALSAMLVVGSGIISLNTLKNLSRRKTHNPSDN
ncbi:MAG: O-antigen/teichoic acid export membrane protein [Bacteroidia bacterium]|jgi:O-antigen/teichoic acid export membrane protein